MKHLSYKAYVKLVMDSTDPKKGTKIAFLIQDCHVNKLHHLRPLDSMKGLRLFIVYRKSKSSNGVIELENLDEFGKAQTYAAYHSWPFPEIAENVLAINLGHADLNVLVDYFPNRPKIAEFLQSIKPEPMDGYSGRPLVELVAT